MALQNQEIGARLRELRRGRPQTAVADALEVSERAYQNWEAGDAKPSYRNLQRLAEFYGVGEDYILTGAPGAPPPETPDLSLAGAGESQLDRIERRLEEIGEERRLQQEAIVLRLDRLIGLITEADDDALVAAAQVLRESLTPPSLPARPARPPRKRPGRAPA